MRNVLDKFVEKKPTHSLCLINIFRKSCYLLDNVEICYRAGQDTDENTAHSYFMLDN
jgi:hypothetical protein